MSNVRPTKTSARERPVTTKSCAWSSAPDRTSYEALLHIFWENHDPTQGMRQGNDTWYSIPFGDLRLHASRSVTPPRLLAPNIRSENFDAAGFGEITTEILEAPEFYYAEDYHQQYLAKNPGGYCGIGGTGVSCPIGLESSD